MAENGEALKYIEIVLRQLRRASRDHRQLVEQRHRTVQPFPASSTIDEYHLDKSNVQSLTIPRGQSEENRIVRDISRDTIERLQEVGTSEEPQELTEYPGVDVTKKLLAKKKTYARGIYLLETMPRGWAWRAGRVYDTFLLTKELTLRLFSKRATSWWNNGQTRTLKTAWEHRVWQKIALVKLVSYSTGMGRSWRMRG